ncbi:MAG: hypothetical protein OEZ48_00120 [Candidatus Bathyarchaeota archaeon]|nr:hypothetical protein [Candidatus Bathyarchaeota archaeon]MDH5686261.1 hypothetical protein [Candidatus Bathyarchaeota archaeon]
MDSETRQALNKMAERYNDLCDVIEDLHGQIEYLKNKKVCEDAPHG